MNSTTSLIELLRLAFFNLDPSKTDISETLPDEPLNIQQMAGKLKDFQDRFKEQLNKLQHTRVYEYMDKEKLLKSEEHESEIERKKRIRNKFVATLSRLAKKMEDLGLTFKEVNLKF